MALFPCTVDADRVSPIALIVSRGALAQRRFLHWVSCMFMIGFR